MSLEKCSALGVEFIFKVLLNFLRTAKVDRELRWLLLLARLYRLRENLQIWRQIKTLNLHRSKPNPDIFWFQPDEETKPTWKALARAKVSRRAVCLESHTKARHSKGCRRVPPSPRSSGASFTTIIAKTLGGEHGSSLSKTLLVQTKDTPGVDEVLDPVADCVNGVKTRLEAWVHISLVCSNLQCGWISFGRISSWF